MLRALVLLHIFGLALSTPVDKRFTEIDVLIKDDGRNSAIEGQLLELLESLRQTMITGSNDIPVLDPLQVDYLTVDENLLPLPGLNLGIKDATVNKLSSFVVEELTVQRTTLIPLRYRLTVDLQIPDLEAEIRNYDLSVTVEGLNIFGNGGAKINIIEPRITGTAILRPTLGIGALYIRIQECEFKFTLKDFQPQVDGLLGGGSAIADFINSFLQYLVVDVVQLYEDVITETISSIVLEVGNDFLSDFNLFDLLG